jgi:serine phosphatase RsbU (regulator of sigma subunit)/anti-sigma regulatory factor (Ser/Thr protein kinase)
MERSRQNTGDGGFFFPCLAAAVTDGMGTVTGWSEEAAGLLGLPAQAVLGRPFEKLLAEPPGQGRLPTGTTQLVHRSGEPVRVSLYEVPLHGAAPGHLLLFAPAETAAEWGHAMSLLRAFLSQRPLGLGIHGPDLRIELTNTSPHRFDRPIRDGDRLRDFLAEPDAAEIESVLRRVLETGEPTISHQQDVHPQWAPEQQWVLSVSAFRLEDAWGRPTGVAALGRDETEQVRLRRHRDLLHNASTRIGFSLDVERTAQALAEVITGDFADLATVDIAPPVLRGDEPSAAPVVERARLLRVAATGTDGWPPHLLQPGRLYPLLPRSTEVEMIVAGRTLVEDRPQVIDSLGRDEWLVRLLVPDGAHSLVVAPLYARGLLLGSVTAWRTARSEPFDDDEAELLTDVASRAALGIDNARRFTREHRAAAALQERLLPRAQTDLPAAETAGAYRPSGGGSGVSGDWFDVIDLPSLRAAFVIGDVIGHGVAAGATMGRLRTAVQTYADLELDPAEVLARVEDLVQRMISETPPDQRDAVGATCLYAVYDPTTCQCTLASAGHPPPVLVGPDGATRVLDVPVNPPLHVGSAPFQSVSVQVEPGSVLALYTDGLLGLERFGGERGIRELREALAGRLHVGCPLGETARSLIADVKEDAPADDVAVLLARTRAVSTEDVAGWQFPADLASVGEARTVTARQLDEWDLTDLAFTTELVVSELVTNAIRYAGGPVQLRLLRGEVLICEVTDPSNTQPRLVRAAATDEGGRGLFIVAQCTSRWGCRYGRQGKTIWTELSLDGASEPSPALFGV